MIDVLHIYYLLYIIKGTFRRSCEEVMRVLRNNSLHLMTILEVVIHDPLYKWSLSPLQARTKQNTIPDFHTDLNINKNNNVIYN